MATQSNSEGGDVARSAGKAFNAGVAKAKEINQVCALISLANITLLRL
jgi:hypothetical protein